MNQIVIKYSYFAGIQSISAVPQIDRSLVRLKSDCRSSGLHPDRGDLRQGHLVSLHPRGIHAYLGDAGMETASRSRENLDVCSLNCLLAQEGIREFEDSIPRHDNPPDRIAGRHDGTLDI
jgi:hypothetical protein